MGQPREHLSFVIEGLAVRDLRPGMIASEVSQPALTVTSFLARVVVLRGPGEATVGFSPVLACHATQAPCRIEELVARIDRQTGKELEKRPSTLRAGDAGIVRFIPELPLCVEAYADCPQLGIFSTTREQTAITMVGVVMEVEPRCPGPSNTETA